MKAILRSINNFSCKLKQSNNLKYNISPKMRSNKFKSISGNGNVTIEDALNKALKDYKVYGNTYQNSTKGINIYNVHNTKVNVSNEVEILSNNYVSCTYDNTNGSTIHYSNFMIAKTPQLQLSTNYLVVCEIQSVSGTGSLYPFTKHTNSCINTQHNLYRFSNLSAGQKIFMPVTTVSSFTGTSSDLRSLIRFDVGQSGSITFRLSLLTDTTITSDTFKYELYTGGQPSPNPDYPQEIVSCGDLIIDTTDVNYGKYKIPVNVRSENLISTNSVDWEQGTISTNGTNRESTIRLRTIDYYEINNDTDYYVSIENENYTFLNIILYDYQKQFLGQYYAIDDRINNTRGLKINIPSLNIPNVKYCRVTLKKSNDSTITSDEITTIKPMITLGNSKIPFVPYYNETTNIYLDEPLRKIDEYSDYIDFINGRVVRNIGKIILNGSEDWTAIQAYGRNYYAVTISNLLISDSGSNDALLYNNYYIGYKSNELVGNNTKDYGICRRNNNSQVLFRDKDQSILSDLTTWLSTHNNIMCYPLSTPTEEDIELPNINLIEGKNIITLGTEVQGVFEVEYYSKEIIDISNYKYNLRKVED